METKICCTCQKAKSLDQFHNYKRSRDGRQGNCIECNKRQATLKNRKSLGLDMDWEKYGALCKQQDGRCAICGQTPKEIGGKEKELAVGHVHGSTWIRGLLCSQCNTAIGMLGEDAGRLRRAAESVETRQKPQTCQSADGFAVVSQYSGKGRIVQNS